MDIRYIVLQRGNLKVILSSLGASIVSISFNDELMTLVPLNLEDLKRNDIYYGKTIGPISNRIKDGLINIDNKEYHLPLNEEGISNHSGLLGLSNKLFVSSTSSYRAIFTYQQKINDINISYGIAYTLNEDNSLRIDYIVRTSDKFMISLTNHPFFTLGESSLDNLSLVVKSDAYIESDKESLLSKELKPLIDCLDFNNEKLIIKDIDDSYLTNHKSKGHDHSFRLIDKNIILKSSKYELDINTDYDFVHLYTDNYSDHVKTKNSGLTIRRGAAIECVDNYLDRPIVSKDEVYQRYIVYRFRKLNP